MLIKNGEDIVAEITGFHTLRYAERVGIDIKSYECAFVGFCKLEQRPGDNG